MWCPALVVCRSWLQRCVYFCVFASGVRAEEASRGRVPPEDGGALRMRPLHGELSEGSFTCCSTKSTVVYIHRVNLVFGVFWGGFVQYADPVADLLDQWGVFRTRLFRESCVFHRGNYVKDLSRLGRELSRVIIIDNSPASYIFHPENAVSQPLPGIEHNNSVLSGCLMILDVFRLSEKMSLVQGRQK